MPLIDLTAFDNPRFDYEVLDADGKGRIKVSLDLDKIGLDLQALLPTLFKQYDGPLVPVLDSAGNPVLAADGKPTMEPSRLLGIQKIFQCIRDGEKIDASLPSPGDIGRNIGIVFQCPEHCGWKVRLQLLYAFFGVQNERAEKKRSTAASPNSSTPTPDASGSAISPPSSTEASSTGCC